VAASLGFPIPSNFLTIGHGFHPASLDQLTERHAELAVPIMQQIPAVGQKSPLLHGHVAPHLLHPLLVRMGRDSGQTNPPTLQLDKEQHVAGGLPADSTAA